MMDTLVLAHQGGWDEILYIIVPVALIVVGVRWAEARARRRAQEEEREPDDQRSGNGQEGGR